MWKWILGLPAALLVLVAVAWYAAGAGWLGRTESAGRVTDAPVPRAEISARQTGQGAAAAGVDAAQGKQILFGDMHVHTTFSSDAFLISLPMLQGEGAHPPADACDFARYCSGLDFWSISDHAELMTPYHWQETRKSVRQCNAVAGDQQDPDMVTFLGWEWTQSGSAPENHYGHKNVIFRDTGDDETPRRPIGSTPAQTSQSRGSVGLPPPPVGVRGLLAITAPGGNRRRYLEYNRFLQNRADLAPCATGVNVRDLPDDCYESTALPSVLYDKLRQWGYESTVIPHGTTWGLYTPPGYSYGASLRGETFAPDQERLIEVFSGHGNSEEFRNFTAMERDGDGQAVCPAPTALHEPGCWRAGEIIAERCAAAGEDAAECEARAATARANYMDAGVTGFRTVPGAQVTDWLDAGQCRDCYLPAFNYRPRGSAQYALALTNFDDPEQPRSVRFGFIGSSDNHTARPGTGYKERDRRPLTEAAGISSPGMPLDPDALRGEPAPRSVPFDALRADLRPFTRVNVERGASFFLTGGLMAAHAAGRDRQSIWEAMERREVYATTGDRILLWFDLANAPGGPVAMGGEAAMTRAPRFQVRAVGAFRQQPGCPDYSLQALQPDRLARLCLGECYNPSDERKTITRIEVVRILPQVRADEPVAGLITDPWRSFTCPGGPEGCVAEFEDPDFADRDAIYYARAIQEEHPVVNADNLRCEYNEDGICIKVSPCYGGYRTGYEDDCLAPATERAFSSPIYVRAQALR